MNEDPYNHIRREMDRMNRDRPARPCSGTRWFPALRLTREELETKLGDKYKMSGSTARKVLDLVDEFGKLSMWVKAADEELTVYGFEDGLYDAFEIER